MYFISPSKHLFKGSASNRSIAVHFLNFFEQILAGWDPTYQTLDVTVDFTFRTCICGYCKKKCSPLHEKCLYSDFFLVPVFQYPKTLNMDTFHALCRSESLTQFSTDSYYYVFSAKSTQAILYILNRVHF